MANNDVPNESTGLLRIVKVREDSGVQGLLPRLLQKDIVLCMMVYFFHQMQGFLPIGPYLLLYERSICYTYYSAHDSSLIGPGGKIDELLCKVVPVQHELAVVRAWEGAFAAIPVFLVAVPFGRIADRYGKKRVVATSLFGLILACAWTVTIVSYPTVFPIRLVWLAPIFWLIGGGDFMPASLIYLMASERVHEQQRSPLYYLLYCIYLSTELIGPYIASVTMDISPYIPLSLTIFCLLTSLLTLAFIGEPNFGDKREVIGRPTSETSAASSEDASNDPGEENNACLSGGNHGLRSLLRSRNVLITLAIFIVPAFRPTTTHVLLQYMSSRFHWKLSQSTIFISEIAVINIILYLLVLPRAILWIETRFNTPKEVIDLAVVRLSLLLLVVGALLLGCAPKALFIIPAVAVFAAGFGLRVSLLSFATWLPEQHVRAQFYGVIQVLENVGYLVAAPTLQGVWASALVLPEQWLMLPFIVAAVIFAVALTLACFLRAPVKQKL